MTNTPPTTETASALKRYRVRYYDSDMYEMVILSASEDEAIAIVEAHVVGGKEMPEERIIGDIELDWADKFEDPSAQLVDDMGNVVEGGAP